MGPDPRDFGLFENAIGFSGPKVEREAYKATLNDLRQARGVHPTYLINSTPKCGSTFLVKVVNHAVNGVVGYGGDLQIEVEQDFTAEGLRRTVHLPRTIVYKHHALQNFLNLQAIKQLRMGYVNMTRGVFDTMVSIHDHLLRGVNPNGVTLWPGQTIKGFAEWSEDQRYHYIAWCIIPWHFRYVEGWTRYDASRVFYYEDMLRDPDTFFTGVADAMGLDRDLVLASAGVNHGDTRKNVAKAGRGDALRHEFRDAFMDLMPCFPNIDKERFVP